MQVNLTLNQKPMPIDLTLNNKSMPIKIAQTIPVLQTNPFLTYTHNQMVASKEWTIHHNLGCYPAVSVVDTGGNVIVGNVQYINENTIIISFTNIFSGKAYLN